MIKIELNLTNETADYLLQGFNEQRKRIAQEMGHEDMTPEREDELTKMLAAVGAIYDPLYAHRQTLDRLDAEESSARIAAREERAKRGERVRLPA